MDTHTWYTFLNDDTVLLAPHGLRLTPPAALDDMLGDAHDWVLPCPDFDGPCPTAFYFLSDGGHRVIDIDTDVGRSSAAFRDVASVASRAFGYATERITVCPALPTVEDLTIRGQRCKTALVDTEAISRLPIPPGRWMPEQHILFLDARYLLRDIAWILAPHGRAEVSRILAPFQHRMASNSKFSTLKLKP